MNKSLSMSIVLVALLAACSSKQVKEEPAAAVEEKSPGMTETMTEPQAATTGAMTESAMGVNPLTDPNSILSKRSVYFDFNKDEVKPEYRDMVEAHAKYLTQNPSARLTVQGNADDRGSREYNLALGQRRAAAVKNVMNVYGASDTQIETVSYGEEKPRCTSNDETCWAENRRADIVYAGE